MYDLSNYTLSRYDAKILFTHALKNKTNQAQHVLSVEQVAVSARQLPPP